MSYTSAAIYTQRRPTIGPDPGDDCDPYSRPSPTSVITNLVDAPVFQTATIVDTNLCAPVS